MGDGGYAVYDDIIRAASSIPHELFLRWRRRSFLVSPKNILFELPELDLVLLNCIFHALLIHLQQGSAAIILPSFQKLLREPTVETRIVVFLELVAFVSNAIHDL